MERNDNPAHSYLVDPHDRISDKEEMINYCKLVMNEAYANDDDPGISIEDAVRATGLDEKAIFKVVDALVELGFFDRAR